MASWFQSGTIVMVIVRGDGRGPNTAGEAVGAGWAAATAPELPLPVAIGAGVAADISKE